MKKIDRYAAVKKKMHKVCDKHIKKGCKDCPLKLLKVCLGIDKEETLKKVKKARR